MSRKPIRMPIGVMPPPRRATKVPRDRPIGAVPGGDPLAHVPPPHIGRAPVERRAAKPPNPRRRAVKRDVRDNVLKDLFEIFADLPRPAHPAARVESRTTAVRRPLRRR